MDVEITYLLKIIAELHNENKYLTGKVAKLESELKEKNTIEQLDTAQKLQMLDMNLKGLLGDDFTKILNKMGIKESV